MITTNRDINRIILSRYTTDNDIKTLRLVNKKWKHFIDTDQTMWMQRIYHIFSSVLSRDILLKYKKERTWSQYYINDLNKLRYIDYRKKYQDMGSRIGRLDWIIVCLSYLTPGLYKNKEINKCFLLASHANQLSVIKYLVERGANIHADNDLALQLAAENGHLDVVKYLVERGANIHARDDYALRYAAENGHLSVVKYLVKEGANIHAGDDYALGWAAGNGHLDVVKYLVQEGADIHARNDDALKHAFCYGHQDVIDYIKSL